MRTVLIAPTLVLLAATPSWLTGQTAESVVSAEEPTPSPSSILPLEVLVEAGGSYFANFFQAPDEEPEESVRATTGQVKVVQPFRSGSYLFAEAGGVFYSEFDPSSNFLGGFGWSMWPHMIEAYGGYRIHAPRLDVGDTLGFANLLYVHASYDVRLGRPLQLGAVVDYYDETHGQRPERNNTYVDFGGSVRYRDLDHLFSPEVGVAFGGRDVAVDTEDLSQRTVWVTLRSRPTAALSLRLRYRDRLRKYSVDDPAASNFDREDRRHEVNLITRVSLLEDLRWTVNYSFQHATSTMASRSFDAQSISVGLEYRLTGGRR